MEKVTVTLKKGTIVHLQEYPCELQQDTEVHSTTLLDPVFCYQEQLDQYIKRPEPAGGPVK
jgi:hypothetical protein